MKNWVLTLIVASLTVPAFAQEYTDARELLKASYEKTGGAKWESIKTMTMSTSMSISTGQAEFFGSTKISFKYPGYTHIKVLLDIPEEMGGPPGGMTQVSIMRPDTTLSISDMTGTQGAPGGQGPEAASEEAKLLADESIELSLETGDLDETTVYVVTAMEDSTESRYYYDMETLYRIARSASTGQGDAMVYYGDYRELDGLMLPYEQKQSFGGMEQTMTVKSIELNPTLDADLFEIK